MKGGNTVRIGKVVREVIVEPRSVTDELVLASDPVVDASPDLDRRPAAPSLSSASTVTPVTQSSI